MKITITCDSKNTINFLDYVITRGTRNCIEEELKQRGVSTEDTTLNVTYAVDANLVTELDIQFDSANKKKSVKSDVPTLYAAREIKTGKLVSDLTNPRRKYWDREKNALSAISHHNRNIIYYGKNSSNHGSVELVKFELVEVPRDAD